MAALGRQIFALAAGSTEAQLFRVVPRPGGAPELETLAAFPGPPTAPATFAGLGEALAGRRGHLRVCLPLFAFETATIDLPLTSREAIGKVLPYHLGKILSRPLGDFVFDWQIVRKQKDSARVSVFLLPAMLENGLKQALSDTRVSLARIEPDIFSLFAYAGMVSLLPEKDSILALIVHDNFIVQGFYENGKLRLVRELKLPVPAAPFDEGCVNSAGDIPFNNNDDILSAFALYTPEQEHTPPAEEPAVSCAPWREYFEQVNLEIIRGRDYYASIMKGAPTVRVILAGDGGFIEPLARSISRYGEMDAAVIELPGEGGGSRLINGLAAGAAAGDETDLERINVLPEATLGQRLKHIPPLLATALALTLALFLAVDYFHLSRRIEADRAKLATLAQRAEAARVLASSRTRLARELKKLSDRRQELEKEAALLRKAEQTKKRYSRWLLAISRILPGRVRCDRIEFSGNMVEIQGRAVDHDAVEVFAERLRRLERISGLALEEVRRGERDAAPLDFRLTCRIKARSTETGGE